VLWTLNSANAALQPLSQTAGKGAFTTASTYDANSGRLTAVRAGTSDVVAKFDYTYDQLGNLTYRADGNGGVYEKFCYDALNRLTDARAVSTTGSFTCTAGGTQISQKSIAYDAVGNITSKSDVGSYSYAAAGSA
jgi:uncharacterized protein RhaS with RHS repeats